MMLQGFEGPVEEEEPRVRGAFDEQVEDDP